MAFRNENGQPEQPFYDGYSDPEEMGREKEVLTSAIVEALEAQSTAAGIVGGVRAGYAWRIRAVDIPSPLGTIHAVVSSRDEIRQDPTPSRTHLDNSVSWWQEGTGEVGYADFDPDWQQSRYGSRMAAQVECLTPEEQQARLDGTYQETYDREVAYRPLTSEELLTLAQGLVSNDADPVRTQQEVVNLLKDGGQWIPE